MHHSYHYCSIQRPLIGSMWGYILFQLTLCNGIIKCHRSKRPVNEGCYKIDLTVLPALLGDKYLTISQTHQATNSSLMNIAYGRPHDSCVVVQRGSVMACGLHAQQPAANTHKASADCLGHDTQSERGDVKAQNCTHTTASEFSQQQTRT